MARGKRAQVLSAEEKLKQALVPDWEQPYKVPGNWVWIKLEFLKKNNLSFFDGDWILSENMDPNGNVRLIQLSDIGVGEFLNKSAKYINEKVFEELGCTPLETGDILISRMAEPIVRSCIFPSLPYMSITAVDVAVLRCEEQICEREYINHLCNANWFTQMAFTKARGTTRVRITRKNLGEMPAPLPPLAEQRRIVARIESLFEKLDHARELVQSALDSFKNRKSAILHKAFAGELTVKWRCENGLVKNTVISSITAYSKVLSKKDQKHIKAFQSHVKIVEMSNGQQWFSCQIGAVGVVTNGSTPSRKVPDFWKDGTIPWVSSGEVRNNVIETTHEKITTSGCDNSSVKQLPVGTVLIAMIGEGKTRGQSAVLNIPATTNQNVAAIIIDHGFIVPHFLWYWLQKEYTKNREKGNGTGPQALNCQRVRELDIVIPPFEEQQEIVRILDSLLEKEQHAEDKLEPILDQIDLLKKSILARAFRGELGTNDPSEESAMELLKNL